ncbi:hypothetical protein EsH8_VI_000375 [Colletotrichum jinshuiense]
MSFRFDADVGRPQSYEEHIVDITGGNMPVVKWRHTPDETDFDDGAAFGIIRGAILEQNNDPQRLRRVAVELAALLPSYRPSDAVLTSVWNLFVSLAQQTPSGNIAMLDLVVILDQLSSSPKTTATVTVDGFDQLSRLHGLNRSIVDGMACKSSITTPLHNPEIGGRGGSTRPSLSPDMRSQKAPYRPSARTDTLTRWINLNAFAALLWSYNLIDGRDFAIQQLRSAFEDRRSADAGDRGGADARLMAAAQWAIHSCQRLYHLSVTSEAASPAEARVHAAKGGEKADERWRPGARFKGRAGFSFRRWEFWQQGFEEAHEFGGGGVEAKVEAGAAAGMMEKVLYAGFEV